MESGLCTEQQHGVVRQWKRVAQDRVLVYRLVRSELETEGVEGQYTTFGVEIIDRSTGERSALYDVSPNCEEVQRFAALCVDLEVSPAHLLDVAENYLAKLYGIPEGGI